MSHRRHAGRALASIVLLAAVAAAGAAPAGATSRTINQFTIKSPNNGPGDMTFGADGAVWYVDQNTSKIGRISRKGAINGYLIPKTTGVKNSKPIGITLASDGAIWFTEAAANKIGRLVSGPHFVQTTIPTAKSSPRGITQGPDGNLYFTEYHANSVNKITLASPHTITRVISLPGSGPNRIASGPDGNLWVTESVAHAVVAVSPGGALVHTVALPSRAAVSRIAAGTDGNMWVAEPGINKVAVISTAGVVLHQYAVAGKPTGVAAGADGNMWVTAQGGDRIARVTPAGTVTYYSVPSANAGPSGIALGGDGNIWFSETTGNRLGRLSDAAGHSSYVLVHDNRYIPPTQGIPLSTGSKKTPVTVRWVFEGPNAHSATDSTGMGLFDSGSVGPVATYSHVFTTAGRFPYSSSVGASMSGTITVTPQVALNAGHTAIVVTVATSYPGGVTTDVQVKTPGAGSFSAAPGGTGLTSNTYTYTPSAGHGTYRFQVETASGGHTSGWSPTVSISF
jgi:streptogramin lyase